MIPTRDNRSLLYRFQGRARYCSFTYPDGAGWKLDGNRLNLTKIGSIKIKLHREITGKIKTATIKREGDQWYVVVRRIGACFNCSIGVEGREWITF